MPIRKELRPLYKTPEYKAARAACRERAGDRCEQCGKPNGQLEWRFVAGEGSDVHQVLIQCGAAHLNNDPANNAPENLKWLCRGCHLQTDAMHHKRTRCARKDAARPLLADAEPILIKRRDFMRRRVDSPLDVYRRKKEKTDAGN